MIGKEFGTAKYANLQYVDNKLRDKETPKRESKVLDTRNRILSQNVRMSLNTRITNLNNNILILGGSGSGKTFRWVKPNLYQCNSSFIITDPKGEIYRSCASTLEKNGYQVKVLNLLNAEGMKSSICYNPFEYLKTDIDVIKLITNLIANTTPKDSTKGDPFWENAESMLLQAIIFYIWKEEPKERRNFGTVLEFMSKAEFKQDPRTGAKLDSELDRIFNKLERSELERIERERREHNFSGIMHPAVTAYNSVMRGAADTVRSIIISANARLAKLKTPEIQRVLSKDEIGIPEIGGGKGMDAKTKTALFCVIPDNDKSYNFIIGMLYTQIFQELYFQADFRYGGRLPIHVTFMLDEFANVALPDDFCSLLSTMRSREISCVIIIQNLAQIKALFKDTWETIPGNCDTTVFLGGNEQSSHKYVSEMLGKATIDKKSDSISKGKQGSSSNSYDRLGRELLLPEEVRKVDGKKCIVFIRGFDPIFDDKIDTPNHPLFKWSSDVTGKFYEMKPLDEDKCTIQFMNEKAVEYYGNLNAPVVKISLGEFLTIDTRKVVSEQRIPMYFTKEELAKRRESLINVKDESNKLVKEDTDSGDKEWNTILEEIDETTVFDFVQLKTAGYSRKQLIGLLRLIRKGVSTDSIKEIFNPDIKENEFNEMLYFLELS
ncbi:MAG TPA: type IV secretory system conjugative DNA transfer family protein [Lachnospiraceae bacterium]|nr:type IV secretory system conjugative DNA transfer family protein [Lachnospiraceae bacterium]